MKKEIEIRELPKNEFFKRFKEASSQVFETNTWFRLEEVISKEQKAGTEALRQRLSDIFSLALGAFDGERLVGWSFGYQLNVWEFRMHVSGVLPEYQGQGIYSALLERIISRTRAEGFQIVTSSHNAANSKIIVAKLKRGFYISGFQVLDGVGVSVVMTRFLILEREAVFEFRTGNKPLPQHLRPFLNGSE